MDKKSDNPCVLWFRDRGISETAGFPGSEGPVPNNKVDLFKAEYLTALTNSSVFIYTHIRMHAHTNTHTQYLPNSQAQKETIPWGHLEILEALSNQRNLFTQ